MFNKLKQFKDLKNQAKTLQDALSKESAQGSANGVTITMNGNQEVTAVSIEDRLLADKPALEKAIAEATNKTVKNVQKVMAHAMKNMGDFDLNKLLGGGQQ